MFDLVYRKLVTSEKMADYYQTIVNNSLPFTDNRPKSIIFYPEQVLQYERVWPIHNDKPYIKPKIIVLKFSVDHTVWYNPRNTLIEKIKINNTKDMVNIEHDIEQNDPNFYFSIKIECQYEGKIVLRDFTTCLVMKKDLKLVNRWYKEFVKKEIVIE